MNQPVTKQFFVLTLYLFASLAARGQAEYFQQEVNMEITVELDDQQHQLRGSWWMNYYNRSPDTLDFVYIHLWPNAYKNRSTAFAQQELRSGDAEFYFAPDEELGFIDSLSFSSKNGSLEMAATEYGPDVVKVLLKEPLAPGGEIRLGSPFRVQFPASFSRLGHVGQSYQVTQWYPKPAVYDRAGWHPMPYLNYGEYYSEFMSEIEVYVTVPDNYVVAATGELLTKSEVDWLLTKAEQDSQLSWPDSDPSVYQEAPFPSSSERTKTLHYRANEVHDFAWFADKRFHVLQDTVHIERREPVQVWSFFTDQQADFWQHSMGYLKRSTRFYSDHVGPYAYPQVTAVQSALSAGGGMEYPMITVIGLEPSARSLDLVLAHEVGHNWFYGVLASNERDHAWLDEGFNSYYEQRYDQEYYGEEELFPDWMSGGTKIGLDEIGYRYYGCQRLGQAPDTPAENLRFYNYWVGAYSIPSKALQQLEGYWGKEKLDGAMQQYYRDWQYRHPGPADTQASFEKYGKEKLNWFFQGLMESVDQQDYAIRRVETGEVVTVEVENKGAVDGPFLLQGISETGDTLEQWYAGAVKGEDRRISLTEKAYREISIDPRHQAMEMHRLNNYWRRTWGTWEPPRFRFITGLKDEAYSDVFFSPLPAYNEDDGTMLGLALTNRGVLPRRVEWYAAPLYGLESDGLVGSAGIRTRLWPSADEKRVRELCLFANLSSFHSRTFSAADLPLRYTRLLFGGRAKLHSAKGSKWEPSIRLRHIRTQAEDLEFNMEGEFVGTSDKQQLLFDGNYTLERAWVLGPMRWSATVEYADYKDDFSRPQNHVKLLIEGRGKMLYREGKAFHWRLFAGFFLHNTISGGTTYTPAQAFSLFDRGGEDYRFDNLYFGRTANEGAATRQLGLRAGGFRAPVPISFGVGRSNKNMISLNTSIDLPFTPEWLPLKPYLDAATFAAPTFDGDENQLLWNGGLALEWMDGRVGVYLPLVGSDEIMDRLKEQGGLTERIGFRLLLTELAPWKWIDELRSW